MNYIRGAVNAISAPYQYYKELPPINPSTLTGAIDVIVIQSPGSSGETELVCSPFHVRFGKWKVLRPSDKKVNVSVNGQPIPFNMKIGDAGEAFFVFETDEDVPPDLVTSPILHPTRPEEEISGAQANATTGRFGAKEDDPLNQADTNEEILDVIMPNQTQQEAEEPEFLDLDATLDEAKSGESQINLPQDPNLTPRQQFRQPSFLRRSASRSTIQQPWRFVEEASNKQTGLTSPTNNGSHTSDIREQDKQVDEALKSWGEEVFPPAVDYHNDLALDIEGYHSQMKDTSNLTPQSSDSKHIEFHSARRGSPRILPSKIPLQGTQSVLHSTRNSSPSDSDSEHETREPSPFQHPHRLRATSEPPPELDDHIRPPTEAEFVYGESDPPQSGSKTRASHAVKLQPLSSTPSSLPEYSWEWGAFPTPSPVKSTFGKGGRLDGGIPWKGKSRQQDLLSRTEALNEDMILGAFGKLSTKAGDDKTLVLIVDHTSISFELSLLSQSSFDTNTKREGNAGEYEMQTHFTLLRGSEEMSTQFEEGKITFSRFMQDDGVITNPALVVKWIHGQYLTRHDHPSLFNTLAAWRMNTLHPQVGMMEEDIDEPHHPRTISQLPVSKQTALLNAESSGEIRGPENKPGSSSWAQWWSRTRQSNAESSEIIPGERPILRSAASAPPPAGIRNPTAPVPELGLDEDFLGNIAPEKHKLGFKPSLPETPGEIILPTSTQNLENDSPTITPNQEQPLQKKFAKTLRLTSDQLKALKLKPGANSITFSIFSGVIACTARIFVWDHSDLVVISDVDGTITKSDGLGHVFAMIGRDWTHVGVAKLYTDIVRNGYKIMYLTSRPIGQADATRGYLKGVKQNDYQLPEGPVIMSPDRLMASLHREVIMRKPEVFKMACLRDIQRLFGEQAKNPFYAGFGNRITDALSYRSVNVPSARIFTIDSSGEVKMELLELAGYKSSYIHMTDLVDQMFPSIHKKWAPEYTDFNYWKIPVPNYPLPDLTPPSPTLSARSDTSNQSALARLRNFRLMGSRANSISISANEVINEDTVDHGELTNTKRDTDFQQMSSFGRLVSGLRRSVSPSSASQSSYAADSDSESDVDGRFSVGERVRRRSMTSMPGTLDDMDFDVDEYHDDHWQDREFIEDHMYEVGDEEYDEGYDGEDDEEMAMHEDLLAATEMKKIPFL